MRFGKGFLSSICLLAMLSGIASAQVLYDPTKPETPDQQGWFLLDNSSVIGTAATITAPSLGNPFTELDSDATSLIQAAYGRLAPAPIVAGTHLMFDLQLESETHNNNNRAGLSVIVLGNNLNGIELGFWTNEVWGQNAGFTHGEGAAFDMTADGSGLGGLNHFDLFFSSSSYSLFANGSTTALLTGSLRNYSSFGLPYTIPNGIFFGDDTTSARGVSRLGQFSMAPEPSTLLLILLPVLFGLSPFVVRRTVAVGATHE